MKYIKELVRVRAKIQKRQTELNELLERERELKSEVAQELDIGALPTTKKRIVQPIKSKPPRKVRTKRDHLNETQLEEAKGAIRVALKGGAKDIAALAKACGHGEERRLTHEAIKPLIASGEILKVGGEKARGRNVKYELATAN